MVENPVSLNVKQIMYEFPQVTLPITLVCAGNRRKEQNQVRKGSGFNWGAGGLSTALFTGPLLRHILALAKPTARARYVLMEGADALPQGPYGTSLRLRHVMDSEKGIMLAYKMNGVLLHPDHGKPIRAVVPGVIGGRSVKWLRKLILSDQPSDNYYHIYDNRVLPTVVTPAMAKDDKNWWMDERYAIYDLNVNSAIAWPSHNSEIILQDDMHECYTVRGYAYSGGGRRVSRVEISLDRGRTWNLADVAYPEDMYRHPVNGDIELCGGKLDMPSRDTCFCWCFWSMDFTFADLAEAKDIVVRAMDEAMNVQPRNLYWNIMGMMNGCWYRVVIHKGPSRNLKFEHPNLPALMPGGWMERVKKAGGDLQDGNWGEDSTTAAIKAMPNAEIVMTNPNVNRQIPLEEIEQHDKNDDAWFIVNGQVYDATKFLKEHPGGPDSIVLVAGTDATDDFMGLHSETAKAMMVNYHIGSVKPNVLPVPKGVPGKDFSQPRAIFLNPKIWQKSRLASKKHITHDTCVLEFELEHAEQQLGLPIGQHIFLRLRDGHSQSVVRAYTPISNPLQRGVFNLLVKMYRPSEQFPSGGKMTMLLDSREDSYHVDVKGPIGGFEYCGRGRVRFHGMERKVTSFAMVCAGTGITPIYQMLRAIVQDESDTTTCAVINGNRLEEDIVCREDLDKWDTLKNVKIWYMVCG